jgi:RNA polymerase primary sigma factor
VPATHDSMKSYMEDVGKIPLISRAEEVRLAGEIAAGSEEARQKLIRSNLRLVVKIAHDFKSLGLPLVDLIAEGNIGLMRAVDKFDPSKGAKFSSYAAWWIKQSMRRALANQSRTVRIPVQSAGKLAKIRATKDHLSRKLDREPTTKEIAESLDFAEHTVQVLLRSASRSLSLQDSLQVGEEGEFEDVIADLTAAAPDAEAEKSDACDRLKVMLERLDEREQMIIVKRFGLDGERPETLQQLSRVVGRTRERVRQIQYSALSKLKQMLDRERREGLDTRLQREQKENEKQEDE